MRVEVLVKRCQPARGLVKPHGVLVRPPQGRCRGRDGRGADADVQERRGPTTGEVHRGVAVALLATRITTLRPREPSGTPPVFQAPACAQPACLVWCTLRRSAYACHPAAIRFTRSGCRAARSFISPRSMLTSVQLPRLVLVGHQLPLTVAHRAVAFVFPNSGSSRRKSRLLAISGTSDSPAGTTAGGARQCLGQLAPRDSLHIRLLGLRL